MFAPAGEPEQYGVENGRQHARLQTERRGQGEITRHREGKILHYHENSHSRILRCTQDKSIEALSAT
jgi:hypothetical protein